MGRRVATQVHQYITFKSIFKCFNIVSLPVFIAPYGIDSDGKVYLRKLHKWICWIVLGSATTASFIWQVVFSVPEDISTNPYSMIGYGRSFLIYSFVVIVNGNICLVQCRMVKIFNQLSVIYEKQRVGVYVKIMVAVLVMTVTSLFGVTIGLMCGYIMGETISEHDRYSFWKQLIHSLTSSATTMGQIYFIVSILVLRAATNKVHDGLLKLEDTIRVASMDFSQTSRNQKIIQTTEEQLQEWFDTYRDIQQLKNKINSVFSLQLLLNTTAVFIEAVYFIFLTIVIAQIKDEATEAFSHRRYLIVAYLGFNASKLLIMAGICTSFVASSQRTGKVVHRVRNRMQRVSLREELTVFSMELLHDQPAITALGFFNVDFALVYNVVGAICMYIIIMLQFNFTSSGKSPYAMLEA